jgi:hypothetical protein
VGDDYALSKFIKLYGSAFKHHYGWDIEFANKLPGVLQQAGFTNINQSQIKLPIGSWAEDQKLREIGLYLSDHILWELVKAILVKCALLGLTREEADALAIEIRKSLTDRNTHAHMKWISVWAQKPLD